MRIVSNCTASTIREAAIALKEGHLVAFPTETVYGLGADATNQDAVARIYTVKGRPSGHPLIVHIASIEQLNKWAKNIPEYAIKLANFFWPGPMTLILPRTEIVKGFITGDQDNVGIRIPEHSVALALLKEFEVQGGLGIAAPSANRFGKVSPTSADDVIVEIGDQLLEFDQLLDGGTSQVGIESTIIDCTKENPIILRPGAITAEMIKRVLTIELKQGSISGGDLKAPGLLESHYAPNAKVFLSGSLKPGDGFIAIESQVTPAGAIRLASPKDNIEFAQILYKALRLADSKKIKSVFVIAPQGEDIAIAIRDRLQKCAIKNKLKEFSS
jgi:L-threonylcarbamoyladenylate synthase